MQVLFAMLVLAVSETVALGPQLSYIASVGEVEANLRSHLASWGTIIPEEDLEVILSVLPKCSTHFAVSMCVPELINCSFGRLLPVHTVPVPLGCWTVERNDTCRHYCLEYLEEKNCECIGEAVHHLTSSLYLSLPHLALPWTVTQQPSNPVRLAHSTPTLSKHPHNVPQYRNSLSHDQDLSPESSTPSPHNHHISNDTSFNISLVNSNCHTRFQTAKEQPKQRYHHIVNLPLGSTGSLKLQVCSSNVTECRGGRVTRLHVKNTNRSLNLSTGHKVKVIVPSYICGCSSNPSATMSLPTVLSQLTITVHNGNDTITASLFNISAVLDHLSKRKRCDWCADGCGCEGTSTTPDLTPGNVMEIFESLSSSASYHNPLTVMLWCLTLWRLWW